MDILSSISTRDVIITMVSACVGAFASASAMKYLRHREETAIRNVVHEASEEVEYYDGREEAVSTVEEKPDIFSIELETEKVQRRPADRGYLLSPEEFASIEEENRHVATYFVEDDILAGYDDELEEIEPDMAYGGIPADILETLRYGGSGTYVMCGNGVTALEIVASHGNYLEEYVKVNDEDLER